MPQPYSIACLQANTDKVRTPAEVREVTRRNALRFADLARWAKRQAPDLGICVLPEFGITGTGRKPVDQWVQIAVPFPGEVTDILGEVCQELGIYLAVSNYEFDPAWEGRFWNAVVLIGPSGDVVLKYRKINDVNHGLTIDTTPGDVLGEYVIRHGVNGVFPVVETPLGNLGCLICYDVAWPEVSRGMALQGAEVLLHPTNEPYGGGKEHGWSYARLSRALENQVYFASANTGETRTRVSDHGYNNSLAPVFSGEIGQEVLPVYFSRGRSIVVGPDGVPLAEAAGPGESVVIARVDIDRLRAARQDAASSPVPNLTPATFEPVYRLAATRSFPTDHWADCPIQAREEGIAATMETVARLQAEGVLRKPDGEIPEPFRAIAIQAGLDGAPAGAPGALDGALARARQRVLAGVAATGARIAVLPNLVFQGLPASTADAAARAWRLDGDEMGQVGDLAREAGVYLAVAILEKVEDWDGPVFNTGVLLGPDGKHVLVQRKIHALSRIVPGITGLSSMRERAVARFGDLLPVVETPVGRIGLVVGEDLLFPEVPRSLAIQGAEILLHPNLEHQVPAWESWQRMKRARTWENSVYLVSANYGAIRGGDAPSFAGPGHSQVVSHEGMILVVADGPGEATIDAEIDLANLTARRAGLNGNFLAQLRAGVYQALFEQAAAAYEPVAVRTSAGS